MSALEVGIDGALDASTSGVEGIAKKTIISGSRSGGLGGATFSADGIALVAAGTLSGVVPSGTERVDWLASTSSGNEPDGAASANSIPPFSATIVVWSIVSLDNSHNVCEGVGKTNDLGIIFVDLDGNNVVSPRVGKTDSLDSNNIIISIVINLGGNDCVLPSGSDNSLDFDFISLATIGVEEDVLSADGFSVSPGLAVRLGAASDSDSYEE